METEAQLKSFIAAYDLVIADCEYQIKRCESIRAELLAKLEAINEQSYKPE